MSTEGSLQEGKPMIDTATDILVDTPNPAGLDRIAQQFGAAMVGGPDNFVKHDGYYVMRVFGNPGMLKFMLEQQGYAKVIRELDELL